MSVDNNSNHKLYRVPNAMRADCMRSIGSFDDSWKWLGSF
jgi:hypothetical protein